MARSASRQLGRWAALVTLGLLATATTRRPAPLLLVTNEVSGDVTIVDTTTDTVVATVPVGKRPRGVRVGPDGATAYVALSGSARTPPGLDPASAPPPDRAADGIGVLDLETRSVVRVLAAGPDPECFDLDAEGTRLYASNEDTAEVSVVDLRSGEVLQRVPVGAEPEGVTTSPDGHVVYVTSESEDAVSVLDARTGAVIARFSTAGRPRAVVFARDGARAWVTAEDGAAVTVVDAKGHVAIGEIRLDSAGAAPRPMGAALSPDGSTLYVTNGRAGTLSVIDTATSRVVRTLSDVGGRPWGVVVSRDGRKVYTANGPSDDVSVIDTATGRVLKRIPVGRSPWGLALAR